MPSDADLQLLLDAFVAIASERSDHAILAQAVDLARLTTRARYGAAARVVDGRITVFAHRGMTSAQVADLPHEPRGLGMLGAALVDRKPIRLDRMDGDARAVGFPLGHVPMRAFLAVPLAHGEEQFGALYLTKPPGHDPFTEADELFVAALGRQTALALEGARALAEVERANAELRRTDELKDELLSMTSHELRTPLTAIRMATGTLRGYWHDTSEERRLELIAIVDSEAHRLSRLVENLLTAASIGAGMVGMQREDLDLGEAVTRPSASCSSRT